MSAPPSLEDISEAFELLPDWDEKYRYLIELGRSLPALAEGEYAEANKVHGCMSQVWLVCDVTDDVPARLSLRADSDAFIVKGLIALVLAMYSGCTADEILALDAKAVFEELGLGGHLSMGRRNGLESMVKRVRALAAEHRA